MFADFAPHRMINQQRSPTGWARSAQQKLVFALGTALAAGCSSQPDAFEAPDVNAESAAEQALDLYDSNGDDALNRQELTRCPGMLGKMKLYDANSNGSLERDEIVQRVAELLNRGTGGTTLSAQVYLNGSPLRGATVVLEPEPYLGGEVQAAQGVTNGAGTTNLAIPPEYVPEQLRRIKTVHYGTFKVRITHPKVPIPAKYNSETQLGYETEPGNPYVTFTLTSK